MPLNNKNNNDCCKCTTPEYTIELNAQGPQGRQGEQGLPGFSPKISVASNTYNQYTLNIQTEDGSITTPNLKASFPPGGNTNDLLIKNSSTNGDIGWANANAIPNIVTTDEDYQQITGVKYFYNDDGLLYAKNSEAPGMYGLSGLTAYMDPDTGIIQVGSALSYLKSNLQTHLILHGAGPEAGQHTPVMYQRINTNDSSNNQSFIMIDNANLKDYLVAGSNITLTPDVTGKITITSSGGELPSNVITSDNISQNEYIQQLEQRIAALEALIDGGNATND